MLGKQEIFLLTGRIGWLIKKRVPRKNSLRRSVTCDTTEPHVECFCVFQADDIRALLIDAMPPEALPTCFKPQATVVSASLISPASTPSCLSAASSIDNLTGPLAELAVGGASNTGDGAAGTERKEGEGAFAAGQVCIARSTVV